MSRIGGRPIKIEDGVNMSISGSKISANFENKMLELTLPKILTAKEENGAIIVNRADDSKEARSQHGLFARLIKNLIHGVKEGFVRELTFTGTGYRVAVSGEDVLLNMGYSHEIKLAIPKEISVEVKKNSIFVKGASKEAVGQFAALIRSVRGPEVYKGKGIKYKEEIIKRKAGKKAAS